jgi:hypothetical protein
MHALLCLFHVLQLCVDCTVNALYISFDNPTYAFSTGILTPFCIRDPEQFSILEVRNVDPNKYWAFTDSKTKAKADDCESLGTGYFKKDHKRWAMMTCGGARSSQVTPAWQFTFSTGQQQKLPFLCCCCCQCIPVLLPLLQQQSLSTRYRYLKKA